MSSREPNLRNTFMFANTIQFLHLFYDILDIDLLTPSTFEEILHEASISTQIDSKLSLIYKKLIKALHRSKAPSDEFLIKSLNREYRRHFVAEPEYLQPTLDGMAKIWPSVATLSPAQHLQTLHDLCSFQLVDIERFTLLPKFYDKGAAWRINPLGTDKLGHNYWFIGGCWLYLEQIQPEHRWECMAWDLSSWQTFLESMSLRSGRRRSDRELLHQLHTISHPAAKEILVEEEKIRLAKRKKEDQQLQRELFLESRKRSSRIAAREKLHQQLVPPMSSKPLVQKHLTRGERMARREKKAMRLKAKQMADELTSQHAEIDGEIDIENNIEEGGQEYEAPRSPVKLFVKMGPSGPMGTNLLIDNQLIDGQTNAKSTQLPEQAIPEDIPIDGTPRNINMVESNPHGNPNIPAGASEKEIAVANLLKNIVDLLQ